MKKLGIVLAGAAFLLSAVSVFGAGKATEFQKLPFFHVDGGSSDNVNSVPYDGFVKVGLPGQSGNLVFSGEIKGLVPLTEYFVWVRNLTGYTGPSLYSYLPLGYFKLTSFTTDTAGSGVFEYTILASELPTGTYPIQVAINYAPSDPIGYTVAATVKFTDVVVGANVEYPGCNKPGTTFVGEVPNPGDPTGPNWRLVMHGSYVLGKCGGTGPAEGDWNVQMAKGPDGNWEFYKNVFTVNNLSDTGAFLYWDLVTDTYHPTFTEGNLSWWILKSNGVSPFLEPFVGGQYVPAEAQPNGFGFYR